LATAAILVILPCHSREHVEHHAIDGVEHAGREVVGVRLRHHPRGWEVQRRDPNTAGSKFRFQLFSIRCIEAAQPVYLFH
jgi:hypothetical protein